MSVDHQLVGRAFEKTEPYLVGREKVREFSRAVFSSSPASLSPEAARRAGYADVVAPPTFAIVIQELALSRLVDEAGIELTHVVHGEQRFDYSRPIVAGDELTAQLIVKSVKTVGANSMVVAESVITDGEGEHVVTAVSTLVVRGDA
ncbi:MaoC family dehydratase N-terminal domain-containing protein [Herbiconiux sp. P17]|uniref:FAS1-like dehydratase domain-containing protein n=1 Tax=Herbiconiux wuyangfengii TaxID=3342794 RepID=UPI0035B75A72